MNYEEIKKELTELRRQRNILWEKRDFLRYRLKSYKDLQNRSECPYCGQKTKRKYYKDEIPNIMVKTEEVMDKLEETYPKIIELEKPLVEKRDKERKERGEKIQGYLKINRNILNKAIRDYDKGVEKYLPDIPDCDKEIWNSAMERQLDNKGFDDNEELMYEGY